MISLHNVSKAFILNNSSYQAIQSVTLKINEGDIHGIIGVSGAGKSTLLRLMNLLEMPDEGIIEVNGQDLLTLTNKERRHARQSIGMIFQHFNLVSNKTVGENVAVPLELAGIRRSERKKRAIECLQFVGLEALANKYPSQLSGGQKQRVAIARAIANRPSVLLCDEPTSALDPNTTREIIAVLQRINQRLAVTIVIVSHEMEVIKSICNQVTVLENGGIYDTISIRPKGTQNMNSSPDWFVEHVREGGDTYHA